MSLLAAMRDASFYANPSVDRPVQYHVVADNGNGPACNPNGALLVVSDPEFVNPASATIPAEDVPIDMRCQRPGCKARWPELSTSSSRDSGSASIDRPRRRVVLLRLQEATERRRLTEEQHEKLIENALAEGHSVEEVARAAGYSAPTIKAIIGRRERAGSI